MKNLLIVALFCVYMGAAFAQRPVISKKMQFHITAFGYRLDGRINFIRSGKGDNNTELADASPLPSSNQYAAGTDGIDTIHNPDRIDTLRIKKKYITVDTLIYMDSLTYLLFQVRNCYQMTHLSLSMYSKRKCRKMYEEHTKESTVTRTEKYEKYTSQVQTILTEQVTANVIEESEIAIYERYIGECLGMLKFVPIEPKREVVVKYDTTFHESFLLKIAEGGLEGLAYGVGGLVQGFSIGGQVVWQKAKVVFLPWRHISIKITLVKNKRTKAGGSVRGKVHHPKCPKISRR
jgi:hypothetical protein